MHNTWMQWETTHIPDGTCRVASLWSWPSGLGLCSASVVVVCLFLKVTASVTVTVTVTEEAWHHPEEIFIIL